MAKSNNYFMVVDVQNLWYSCRHVYGPDFRVDFKGLLDFTLDHVLQGVDPVLNATAYLVVSSNHDQTNFINALRQLEFNIKKRSFYYNKSKPGPGVSWNVGITADAFVQADSYDKIILVSGDGDFTYLAEPLRELGKEVIILAFEDSLSKQLSTAANEVFYIGRDSVYSPKQRFSTGQRDQFVTD